jgi:F-type H+-transporting ATPase subunit b
MMLKQLQRKKQIKLSLLSNQQLAQDVNIAKEQLKNDISRIAIECAEKIIKAEINEEKHKAIFDDALKELK